MNTYTLPSRSIPLSDEWDVVVIGGGPSGCAAAASAAREGSKTLLVEAGGFLGGAATAALVPAWCPFTDKEKIIYRGIAERVLETCKAGMPHVGKKDVDWVPIDPERLKRVYDDLVTESGAALLFNTMLSSVDLDGKGGVSTLLVTNKQGLSALKAKVYIDCTGDADLAAWAGAEFHKGDDHGELMPATHCFTLSGVNNFAFQYSCGNGRLLHANNPKSPLYEAIASKKYPLIPDAHLCCSITGPGVVGFNAGHLWKVDNTDPASVSKALVKGRKMAAQFRDLLAEACPEAFANAFLVNTANQVGIRESRRIVGDYCLTLDDYLARRSFPDEICRNAYFIDVHHSLKAAEKNVSERREGLEDTVRYGPGESHGIPYRCLLPKGLRNVLVAGRSISCERIVQGSVRVMPACLAMGEATGLAASLALQTNGGDVHAVNTDILRERLRDRGAFLP
ncbi:MAG: FAD-dependent oxidoreductase [Chthoniobacteraceae bacterium]